MADITSLLYGTASDVAKNTTAGFAQSVAQGAGLALEAEKVQQNQLALQQKQQELQQTRMAKFAEAVEKGQQYTGKAQTNYYNKFLPQYKNALGLKDLISDDAIQFAGASPETIYGQQLLWGAVANGKMDYNQALKTYHDPIAFGQYAGMSPDLMNVGAGSNSPDPEFIKELQKAQETRINADAQQAKLSQQAQQDYRQYGAKLNEDVATRMKPIAEKMEALNTATNAISKLQAQFNAGQKPNSNLANAAARGIAKAYNTGALSDRDVEAFQNRSGIAGWTQGQINKWITGGVDMQTMQNLIDVLDSSKQALALEQNNAANALRSRFQAYPGRERELEQISGLNAYVGSQGSAKTNQNSGGFTLAQLEQPNVRAKILQKIQANPANAAAIATRLGISVNQLTALLGAGGK